MKVEVDIENLANIVRTVKALQTEAIFTFGKDGTLDVKAVDNAHVAMVHIEGQRGIFLNSDVDKDTDVGVDLDKIDKFLSVAKSQSKTCTIDFDETSIKMIAGKVRRSFPALTINANVKLPTLKLDARVVVPYADITLMLKASKDISDHARFDIKPDGMTITVSEDANSSVITIPVGDVWDVPSDVFAMYPYDYLQSMFTALGWAKDIGIALSTNFPMEITANAENVNVAYMIAPRIEND